MIKAKQILLIFFFSFALNAVEGLQLEGSSSSLGQLENTLQSLRSQPLSQVDYYKTTKIWKELFNLSNNKNNQSKKERTDWENKRNDLLLKAGTLRYQVIESDYFSLSATQYIQDSFFELKIIPQKWIRVFEAKYQVILEKGSKGTGPLQFIRSLLPEIYSSLLFILLPLIVLRLNSYLLNTIEKIREDLSDPYRFTTMRRRLAITLQRIGPFIPLLLSILALEVFSNVIRKTIVAELDLLIPLILYYLYYKIFHQLVLNFFIVFSEYLQLGRGRQVRAKIYLATKALGQFFFIALLSLHLVSSVAGKGLLYHELYLLLWISGAILYIWLIRSWSEEIDHHAKRMFGQSFLSLYEKSITIFGLNFLIRTLTFIYILSHPLFKGIKEKFLEIGLGKTILSKVFQKKLESDESLKGHEEAGLPEEYKEWFGRSKDEDDNLWIKSTNQRLDDILIEIDEWLKDESEEHSLAIYGDNGIGKTQVIRNLERSLLEHEQKPEIIVASVPPKITTKSDVLRLLGQLLTRTELGDIFSLLDFDKKLVEENKKIIIILDDAHNFFLTHFGGLKGIETFFEALNLRTNNIFWIATFNTYSWIYLDQVFHKNKYFRTVFHLKGFNDEELQSYILKRHERSGYSLSYADIIRAVKTKNSNGDFSYVENMFFRLLWDQSQGNPELAEKLWLRALKPQYGKRLKVGLPLTHNLSILKELTDEAFFVFAALMRHENLTTNEFIQVTDMKEGLVRHSLRIGLENNFIRRDEASKRYHFAVEGQYHVLNILKAKNFIYF